MRIAVRVFLVLLLAGVVFLSGYLTRAAAEESLHRPDRPELVPVPPYLFGSETQVGAVFTQAKRDAEIRVWLEAVATERARLDALAQIAAPEVGRFAPGRNGAVALAPSGPAGCDGHVVPGYILQRESGCSYDAYNPTGCGGSGCIGLYQLDAKHYQGTCAGLDTSPAGQDECARRLSDGGRDLSPWAATR